MKTQSNRPSEREILTTSRESVDKKRLSAIERLSNKNVSDIRDLQDNEAASVADENTVPYSIGGSVWHDAPAATTYKGPLEIASISVDTIKFYAGKALFKGSLQDVGNGDGIADYVSTGVTLSASTWFYIKGVMEEESEGSHTIKMTYTFEKAETEIPPAGSDLIEHIPCWYIPVTGDGDATPFAIDVANIERWLSITNISKIS